MNRMYQKAQLDEKMKYLNYKVIRNFMGISIKKICDKEGIGYESIRSGKAHSKTLRIVRSELERQLRAAFLVDKEQK